MKYIRLAAAGCLIALFHYQGHAQVSLDPVAGAPEASSTGGLEEIIVTAEKKTTTVQTTPIAITAISGEELSHRQITNIDQLSAVVPSFVFTQVISEAEISIRGIGL